MRIWNEVMKMAMRLETVNVDKIFNNLLSDVDMWGR
jgi:hypothetical protein